MASGSGFGSLLLRTPTSAEQSFMSVGSDKTSTYGTWVAEDRQAVDDQRQPQTLTGGSTVLGTVYTTVNIYVGLGLLSEPYAFQRGGYVSLAVLLACCGWCYYTGNILTGCFRGMDMSNYIHRGGPTYANLAHSLVGEPGRVLIILFSLTEFLGVVCMAHIILWQTLHSLIPSAQGLTIAALSIVSIVPAMVVPTISGLTVISLIGALSSLQITAAAAVVWLSESTAYSRHEDATQQLVVWRTLPMSFGILLLSFSAHSCLPAIRASMMKPGQFNRMLMISFAFMAVTYSIMGWFGYAVFGDNATALFTTDMASAVTRPWHYYFVQVVLGCVILKAYTTAVPILHLMASFPVDILNVSSWTVVLMIRFGMLIGSGLCAYFFDEYLGYLEALVGGVCTLCTTLLFPLYFHYLTWRHRFTLCDRIVNALLIALSGACMVLVTYSSVSDLLMKLQQ